MQRLIIISLIGIAIVGCRLEDPGSPILDENSCVPPCWQSIVPGETTQEELLDLLSRIPMVDHTSVKSVKEPESIFSDTIYATLYPDEASPTNLFVDLLNDRVAVMSFEGHLQTTIEEAIEKLGEPEFIVVFHSTGDVFVTIINPAKGIAFAYSSVGRSQKARLQISPDTKIGYLDLFDPAAYQEISDTGIFSFHLLDREEGKTRTFPWKGYGRIDQLYP